MGHTYLFSCHLGCHLEGCHLGCCHLGHTVCVGLSSRTYSMCGVVILDFVKWYVLYSTGWVVIWNIIVEVVI